MTDVGTEQKVYPWGEGMPTGPDVAMLQKQYRDLQPGDRIEYEDVEILLGVDRRSARWASVTNAWRRREFENGIVIDCDPGEAFIVLTADQISAKTYGAIKHVGHTVRKQLCVAAHHLLNTFSAKPGKSRSSMTRPSSSVALPLNLPNT